MRLKLYVLLAAFSVILLMASVLYGPKDKTTFTMIQAATIVKLPAPRLKSEVSVEEALQKRRSVREFRKEPLPLSAVAQLLWAAQGITDEEGKRTAPSAGALYPLEIYLVCGEVEGLPAGVYHYQPKEHALALVRDGDKRKRLSAAAGLQSAVYKGAAVLTIAADYKRTTAKYHDRGKQYVHMEAGHASQNVYLQATALNIHTVAMGAFSDTLVKMILSLPANEQPLYLMPLGY